MGKAQLIMVHGRLAVAVDRAMHLGVCGSQEARPVHRRHVDTRLVQQASKPSDLLKFVRGQWCVTQPKSITTRLSLDVA